MTLTNKEDYKNRKITTSSRYLTQEETKKIVEPLTEAHGLSRDRGDCHKDLQMTTKDRRRRESSVPGPTTLRPHPKNAISS